MTTATCIAQDVRSGASSPPEIHRQPLGTAGPRDPQPGHAAMTKEAASTPEATEGRGTSLENKEDEFIRKVSVCILMHLYKRPAGLSSRRPPGRASSAPESETLAQGSVPLPAGQGGDTHSELMPPDPISHS